MGLPLALLTASVILSDGETDENLLRCVEGEESAVLGGF